MCFLPQRGGLPGEEMLRCWSRARRPSPPSPSCRRLLGPQVAPVPDLFQAGWSGSCPSWGAGRCSDILGAGSCRGERGQRGVKETDVRVRACLAHPAPPWPSPIPPSLSNEKKQGAQGRFPAFMPSVSLPPCSNTRCPEVRHGWFPRCQAGEGWEGYSECQVHLGGEWW